MGKKNHIKNKVEKKFNEAMGAGPEGEPASYTEDIAFELVDSLSATQADIRRVSENETVIDLGGDKKLRLEVRWRSAELIVVIEDDTGMEIDGKRIQIEREFPEPPEDMAKYIVSELF